MGTIGRRVVWVVLLDLARPGVLALIASYVLDGADDKCGLSLTLDHSPAHNVVFPEVASLDPPHDIAHRSYEGGLDGEGDGIEEFSQ